MAKKKSKPGKLSRITSLFLVILIATSIRILSLPVTDPFVVWDLREQEETPSVLVAPAGGNNTFGQVVLVPPAPANNVTNNITSVPSDLVKPSAVVEPFYHPNFTFPFPACLVHVGKAAGSTLSCGLGLTYADCEGMPRDPLPYMYFGHMRRWNCPVNKPVPTYLITLRNPLHRIQSWFDFEKNIAVTRGKTPRQQAEDQRRRDSLFRECYTNFSALVSDGLRPLEHNVSSVGIKNMTCPERAWAAILGVRAFSYHEWYNYEYYWTVLQNRNVTTQNPETSLYALRSEHLLEDWTPLSKEPIFRSVNRKSKYQPHNETTSSPLSITAKQQLCRALCPDIQVYRHILQQVVNLSPEQRQESMQEIVDDCPDLSEHCPGIPDFPRLPVPRRQYRTEVKQRLFQIKD